MAALGYETTKVLAARHHVSVETLLGWAKNGKLPRPAEVAPEIATSWKKYGNVWLLSESVRLAVKASRERAAAGGAGRPIGTGA